MDGHAPSFAGGRSRTFRELEDSLRIVERELAAGRGRRAEFARMRVDELAWREQTEVDREQAERDDATRRAAAEREAAEDSLTSCRRCDAGSLRCRVAGAARPCAVALEADLAVAVLRREPFGPPLGELALVVGRRRQVVLAALRADERFARVGAGAGTRWRLAPHPWEQAGTASSRSRNAQHVPDGRTHARPPAP